MPPKKPSTIELRDASWNFGPSNHPIVMEHRMTVVEVDIAWIKEDVKRIKEAGDEPRRHQWLRALPMIREILPYCIGFGMIAAAIAGKVPW